MQRAQEREREMDCKKWKEERMRGERDTRLIFQNGPHGEPFRGPWHPSLHAIALPSFRVCW